MWPFRHHRADLSEDENNRLENLFELAPSLKECFLSSPVTILIEKHRHSLGNNKPTGMDCDSIFFNFLKQV